MSRTLRGGHCPKKIGNPTHEGRTEADNHWLARLGLRVVLALLMKAAAPVTATRDCPLRGGVNGWSGSIATLRFLNLRPFDQVFMWLGSTISERPHCGFLHGGRDDELRLLSA
jgi:hypothetical protein